MADEKSPIDVDMEAPIASLALVYSRRKKKNTMRKKQAEEEVASEGFTASFGENHNEGEFSQRITDSEFESYFGNQENPQGISVSEFDYSVENHFKAVDTISKLCGETGAFDSAEIQRLSSSVKFLREWRQFSYPPRTLRFLSQNESISGNDFVGAVTLPQFSSAAVPKKSAEKGEVISELRKDFVMHVGGLVSALDWCPRVHSHPNSEFRSEFIAVAAHPPKSSYHKIGAPVVGRGMVQIWCVLSSNSKRILAAPNPKKRKQSEAHTEKSSEPERPQGRPRKHPADASKNSAEQRPRGRPRKHPVDVNDNSAEQRPRGRPRKHPVDVNDNSAEQRPRGRPRKHPVDVNDNSAEQRPRGRPRKNSVDAISNSSEQLKPQARRRKASLSNNNVKTAAPPLEESSTLLSDVDLIDKNGQLSEDCGIVKEVTNRISVDMSGLKVCKKLKVKGSIGTQDAGNATHMPSVDENAVLPSQDIPTLANFPDTIGPDSIPCSIQNDVAMPRLMFCLAHNGKVAWDLKWRPSSACDQQRMGNLAVLLGNGALEVWEVPFPCTINSIYSESQVDTTDPRFIKLQPVFRCSTIKCGDRQSIPLSLEWSSSSPHDKILAGCHDGVVALWKFCASNSLEETRPLLSFSADTAPIRTLSWAPIDGLSEDSNVVVTGGLKGLKFWDLRDPFNPLWVLNPSQQIIYSLDWLPDPRCIIVAFEDGTLRTLSLSKSANDAPVTGEPFSGTQQKGYHSYYCSRFSIWSVHVSRLTGMVAYCGADGTALYFQLTTKAVDKNPQRNRAPHFLCGMLMEEESTLTMLTPMHNIPFPMKKTDSEWAQTPRSKRGFMTCSTQEKKAKEKLENVQRSDVQPLAPCYNSDPEVEFGTNHESEASTSKRQTNSKKKAKEVQQPRLLVCGNDNQDKDVGGDEQASLSVGKAMNNVADETFESLPPKMVALHKVRWNVNVGSEHWLCYGGAAGILRCQEMNSFRA